MRTFVPKNVKLVPPEATCVFKGIMYSVYHWQQKRFDGSEATFEMLKRADTVKVIAIKDGAIVAITDKQPSYRPKFTLPGGRHDIAAETELDCVKRELHEETGMIFKNWKLIYARQLDEKIEQIFYLFVATGLEREDAPTPDSGGENINVKLVSFDDAKKMALEGSNKYWPNEVLRSMGSLDELIALPELT